MRSPVAEAVNPAAQARSFPVGGAALLAAGAQIASSMLDGVNRAASTGVLGSLCIHVTPVVTLHLSAHISAPAADVTFIAMGTSPRTSRAACPTHRPVQRHASVPRAMFHDWQLEWLARGL